MRTLELLNYFGLKNAGEVTWAHAVNSKQKLAATLNDPQVLFVESDICLNKNGAIVAAHPPETESDLTLDELLESVRKSKRGLKLDFKDPASVGQALHTLRTLRSTLPIILNADILRADGGDTPLFNPNIFINECVAKYPDGLLSLGWKTKPSGEYTRENIDEMLALCQNVQDVTFPVRACLMPKSWRELKRLIDQDGRTLTIWNNEPIQPELRAWIYKHTDPQKTFYDLSD